MLKEIIKTKEDLFGACLGTFFADGCISKNRYTGVKGGKYAYAEFTHTAKNLDYLKLKKELLEMIPNCTCKITEHNKKTENKTYSLYRLMTNVNDYFADIRDQIYDENRIKIFPEKLINKITDFGLFLLYLDDGTLKVRYYENSQKLREARVTFCLNSFTLEEIKTFQKWLKEKYDVDSKYYLFTKNLAPKRGYVLWTNTTNTRKLMNVFDKFYNLVPSMQYKFLKFHTL